MLLRCYKLKGGGGGGGLGAQSKLEVFIVYNDKGKRFCGEIFSSSKATTFFLQTGSELKVPDPGQFSVTRMTTSTYI